MVILLNWFVWFRLKYGYLESYRVIVFFLYFLNILWFILKYGYLEMLLKVIFNFIVNFIIVFFLVIDDFKEFFVFVKELVDMEVNDGDWVELVVKVEG